MNGIFRWTMRHGAKFLFVLAIVQLLVGLLPLVIALVSETRHMASNLGYAPGTSDLPFALQLQLLFSAIMGAAFPFFGALVIDRFDRWLAVREKGA